MWHIRGMGHVDGNPPQGQRNGKLGLICKRDNIYTSKALDMRWVANGSGRDEGGTSGDYGGGDVLRIGQLKY